MNRHDDELREPDDERPPVNVMKNVLALVLNLDLCYFLLPELADYDPDVDTCSVRTPKFSFIFKIPLWLLTCDILVSNNV